MSMKEEYTAIDMSTAAADGFRAGQRAANDHSAQSLGMVGALVTALDGLLSITQDSAGVAGYHLNGNVAEWDEFPKVDTARDVLRLCREQPSAAQSAPAGEREAFELASVDDSFGSLRALGAEAERRGIEDGDYIDFAARKAWEYFKAGAAWQRTQAAGVPDDAMVAVASAAYEREALAGATHEQAWHVALSEAIAAAQAQPAAQREWPDDEIVAAWKWCEENGGTPAEFLSHSLLVKRSRVLGRPLTWREAIELTAITTNMPDEERDKLLAIDDEPDAATQDQGEVQRLREALSRTRDVLKIMRQHEDQPNGYKYPVSLWFPAIDALLATSTGQEV